MNSVLIGLVVVALTAEGAESESTVRGELEAGLRFRQSAVTSVSVRSHCRFIVPSQTSQELDERSVVVDYISDNNGRFRQTVAGEEFGHSVRPDGSVEQGVGRRHEFREIAAFDGSRSSRIYGAPDGWSSGSLSREPRGRLPFDPLEFGTHFTSTPVVEILGEDYSWQIVQSANLDNPNLIVVESRPGDELLQRVRKDSPGVSWWYQFWIDSDRGYVVSRAHAYMQRRQDSEPFLHRSFEATGWVELEPNIWMPSQTEWIDYMTPSQGPYRLNLKLIAKHENWAVNQRFSAETFKVSFPAGVEVNDAILGRAYTASQINDSGVAAAAAQAQSLAEVFRKQRSQVKTEASQDTSIPPVEPRVPRYGLFAYTSTWLYALGILIAAVALAVAYTALRRS
jgi:hypothetical protein